MLFRRNPFLRSLKVYPVVANGHSHSDRCDNIGHLAYCEALRP